MSTTARPPAAFATHEVSNQVPPLYPHDLFSANRPLAAAAAREGAAWVLDDAAELGRIAGGDPIRWGFEANENPPKLRTHDRWGHRIDEVEFHPAWHQLMDLSARWGLHGLPWEDDAPAGAHAARAALYMTLTQAEGGFGCPVTMTFAAVPALRAEPDVAAEWVPRLTARGYEPELGAGKATAKCGMAMTEKQGGSDVRANTTRAEATGEDGWYAITGHKWFCSAPMCDLFLVLAQTDEGVTCFALPRILPDGTRNQFHLQRLKDKLGNKSNASSEVEFHGALAQLVGEPGRGVRTIIEMVNHTRLDCVLGSAAGMRSAVAHATHHAAHRSAFGRHLIDQPLMQNVLADLCVESEAATLSAMRLARAYDEDDAPMKRLATAVLKYWVCKRGPVHAAEALECLGGNGYVEESGMPRIYREQPLMSVWEGSGNVMALDVLRALVSSPQAIEAVRAEIGEARGADARLDAFADGIDAELRHPETLEARARRVVERIALALQGSLMVRYGLPASADAFCAARLGGEAGLAFGTLPDGIDAKAIVEHHRPAAG